MESLEEIRAFEKSQPPEPRKSELNHSVVRMESLDEIIAFEQSQQLLQHQESEPREWLRPILEEGNRQLNSRDHSATNSKLHKVPKILREIEKNKECYDPMVVSIGPYHHGKPELQHVEMLKTRIAFKFVRADDQAIKRLDRFFGKIVRAAMDWYDYDWKTYPFNNNIEKIARMMFLDGCFILYFVQCYCDFNLEGMEMKYGQIAFVKRDLFLLENQLPFFVLKALLSLAFGTWLGEVLLRNFIISKIDVPLFDSGSVFESFHLLDLLWRNISPRLPSAGGSTFPPEIENDNKYMFSSVNKLKAEGIKWKPLNDFNLNEVRFIPSLISGNLLLPPLTIDDLTKSMFLNLVAYEACPHGPKENRITSYICFMDSLIDSADDVKELRSNYILRNLLRSNEQVTELFHSIAIGLKPDPSEHQHIWEAIKEHCNNKRKTWIYSSFSGRWTSFIYVTTILVIGLSIIQTYFTIFPSHK